MNSTRHRQPDRDAADHQQQDRADDQADTPIDQPHLAHHHVVLGAHGVAVLALQGAAAVDDPAEPGGQQVHDVAHRHQHEHRRERELDGLGDHCRSQIEPAAALEPNPPMNR
jgi:hypothetical protein